MKKTVKLIALLLALLTVLSLSGCGKEKTEEVWKDAVYTTDAELGDGAKTFGLKITAAEKSILITVHTDADYVGEALTELWLIEGEQGDYGMYIKQVNGITADFDTDKTYWAFYVDGVYSVTSADMTEITEGAEYTLAREK